MSMISVVDTQAFVNACKGQVSDDERMMIVDYVASNPSAGIALGGGLRKLRIPRQGGGKSGGYRVVYLFAQTGMPLFLLTLFAKNEKSNLTPKETEALAAFAKSLMQRKSQ